MCSACFYGVKEAIEGEDSIVADGYRPGEAGTLLLLLLYFLILRAAKGD